MGACCFGGSLFIVALLFVRTVFCASLFLWACCFCVSVIDGSSAVL